MLRDVVEQDGICPSDQERYTLGPSCDPTRIAWPFDKDYEVIRIVAGITGMRKRSG